MSRHTFSRAAFLAAQSTEWLVLIGLFILSIPPVLVRPQSLKLAPGFDLLDGSWALDTGFKAAGGIWFGRDVAFTYGPLFQWLSGAPSRWIGVSTGSVYATSYVLPFLVIVFATWFTTRLLLPEADPWRRALVLLFGVAFWSRPDVRISLCLLAFVIFVRLTSYVAAVPRGIVLPALAAAIVCVATFLVSADAGLYSAAALLLCVVATAIIKRRWRRLMKFLLVSAVCLVLLVVLSNAVLLSAFNFNFWRSTLAIAVGYRWFEPLAMSKVDKRILLATLGLGAVVFGVAWCFRRPGGRWSLRPSFLLAGFAMGVLMMQSGLVRSDHGHVLFGIYAMIFLCGVVAIDQPDHPNIWSLALFATALVVALVVAGSYPIHVVKRGFAQVREMVSPLADCPEGYQEFDHACFVPTTAALLSNTSIYVDAHAGPGDPIAIFPYETAFGLTSRHQVAGGVMQSYLVNGEYLTGLELLGLQHAQPPLALYFPDGLVSQSIDGVPNFTRSPELWFYLLRHYRAEGSPELGVIGLLPDEGRGQRLLLTPEKIADLPGEVRIQHRVTSVNLGPIRWPDTGADFLRLKLRVNYPAWWKLRKPSQLTLQMSFSDGSQKAVNFLVKPNQAGDVWVYPWDDKGMGNYFFNDESEWRSESRPPITGITLRIAPFDWISVIPASVSVNEIEAVRMSLAP